MITDEQVRLLRHKLSKGLSKEAAAAASGMSVRSAQKWQSGPMPSGSKGPRHWRTRSDPFEGVWDAIVVPLLSSDEGAQLQATTVLEVLEAEAPGCFGAGHLRTLQRRMRDWRALHGPDKDVMFPQEHVPGREAAMDFTHGTSLGVTISGRLFVHLLFQFILSFSKWRAVSIAYGETFEALVAGMQAALYKLGGVPEVGRTDNLSAATHELKGAGRPLTKRFKAVLDHYGMGSTRIRPGRSNENGIVEKGNDVLKTTIDQALIVRGSREFENVEAYETFLHGIVDKLNGRVVDKLQVERVVLRPLPSAPVPNYSTYHCVVRSWSTIHVSGRIYSVPSRLQGHEVEVRVHPDEVEVRYNDRTTAVMPRLRGSQSHRIDYRHIIWSLVRKPGAFARYRFREELFPTPAFRRAYDEIHTRRGDRADIEYVRILHLAASTMESQVEAALVMLLEREGRCDYDEVKALVAPDKPIIPEVHITLPSLDTYNELLAGGAS
jgi:Mu transposase, C-terminal domain